MSTNRSLCAAVRTVFQRRNDDRLSGILQGPNGTFRNEIAEATNAGRAIIR